ncbi:hypothetical protein ACFYTS_13300 [Nocardia sp. NPDC004151]|uniref:hypothetical protein n=1 Tax=Nocardia sp. NPDC004151 TaxID=3364304 RepID=UPI0036C154CF
MACGTPEPYRATYSDHHSVARGSGSAWNIRYCRYRAVRISQTGPAEDQLPVFIRGSPNTHARPALTNPTLVCLLASSSRRNGRIAAIEHLDPSYRSSCGVEIQQYDGFAIAFQLPAHIRSWRGALFDRPARGRPDAPSCRGPIDDQVAEAL